MFDFIEAHDYTPYFNYAVLILLIFTLIQCWGGIALQKGTARMNAGWGLAVVIILILYMGLRPVSSVFGDTMVYAAGFNRDAASTEPFHWYWRGEWAFGNLTRWLAKMTDIHGYFLCCATIYVGALPVNGTQDDVQVSRAQFMLPQVTPGRTALGLAVYLGHDLR